MSKGKYEFDLIQRDATSPGLLEDDENASPLHGYKTNDTWWRKPDEEHHITINTKVLGCGSVLLLLLIGVIVAVVWGADTGKVAAFVPFDHTKVRVSAPKTACTIARNCTSTCGSIAVEHALGCCSGCGIPQTCNFPVTMTWNNVPSLGGRQRIWLFVSLDGHYFFQSGFAPYITNTSGTYTIQDGCFGDPGFAIILVGCLTQLNLQDLAFEGFPAHRCNSTWGLCTATQGILVQNLDVACTSDQWKGNFYINSWDGPLYSGAVLRVPTYAALLAALALLFSYFE